MKNGLKKQVSELQKQNQILQNTPQEAEEIIHQTKQQLRDSERSARQLEKEVKRLEEKSSQLEDTAKQLEEKNKYLYLYADFDNFKKRAVKERSELIKFGWESVARELLGVLDNLDLALAHVPPGADKNWVDGLRMVAQQFQATLEKQGVTPVRAQGFDPNLHEAVGQENSDQPAGTIIKEHSRGYLLHGRLLRPARVVVSSGNSASAG